MKKTITIRLSENELQQLTQIDEKQTTAAQIAMQVFLSIREKTLKELEQLFTPQEVETLSSAYKEPGLNIHQITNKAFLVAILKDVPGFTEAKFPERLRQLTAVQAAILHLILHKNSRF